MIGADSIYFVFKVNQILNIEADLRRETESLTKDKQEKAQLKAQLEETRKFLESQKSLQLTTPQMVDANVGQLQIQLSLGYHHLCYAHAETNQLMFQNQLLESLNIARAFEIHLLRQDIEPLQTPIIVDGTTYFPSSQDVDSGRHSVLTDVTSQTDETSE